MIIPDGMRNGELLRRLSRSAAIFWDFDGVLLDSMSVRSDAFRFVLREYPVEKVEDLVRWHVQNGGLSRYVKFRRFQADILGLPIDEDLVQKWAAEFSRYCKQNLSDPSRLIKATNATVRFLEQKVPMHIVSGSDGKELRDLCEILQIGGFFVSIDGSPTPKEELIGQLILKFDYDPSALVMIGDSINDFVAAKINGVPFIGFGDQALASIGVAFWENS